MNWRDFPTPWRRPQFDRKAAIDSIVERIFKLAELTRDPADENSNLFFDTATARAMSEDIRTVERARLRDYDGLEATFVSMELDRQFKRLREPRKGKAQYNKQVKRDDFPRPAWRADGRHRLIRRGRWL